MTNRTIWHGDTARAFRPVKAGVDRLPPGKDMPRHRHFESYVTLVLDGAFEQVSYAGRLKIEAGDVLINPTFDCHSNRMLSRGLALLRLPWREESGVGGVYRSCDVEDLRRIAERDVQEAAERLAAEIAERELTAPVMRDACDELAVALRTSPWLRIAHWSEMRGLTREHISRAFRRVFGVSPARFRGELLAREAWSNVVATTVPLSKIAMDLGYSDQSHMSRCVKAFTGHPPARWRSRSAPSKSAGDFQVALPILHTMG